MENGDVPARRQRLDHRPGRIATTPLVVGGDLRDDLYTRFVAGNVHGNDRNARRIRLLDDGNHRLRLAGAKDDGDHFLNDEVLHLIRLQRSVAIGAQDIGIVAVLFGFFGDVVANHLKKRVL